MEVSDVIGQEFIKENLANNLSSGRIPHAQLFVGSSGSGVLPMAIAHASDIICKYSRDYKASRLKTDKLVHPDLHFSFPVAINEQVKSHPVSDMFLDSWRTFMTKTPYGSLFDWYSLIGIENKQGQISVDQAKQILKSLQLKPFESEFKVSVVWMPEKLNNTAANKLLKIIEEPTDRTVFIFVAEQQEKILKTIVSRCQIIYFPPLSQRDIQNALSKRYELDQNTAYHLSIQARGDFSKAIKVLKKDNITADFYLWFVTWIRFAFKAKGNASVIQDLIQWSDKIASKAREVQKQFLCFCAQMFRQALLLNYSVRDLVFFDTDNQNFKLEKFAPFIHSLNILEIYKTLEDAIYHIERNVNSKMVLLDSSIKLTRLLHLKES